MYQKKLPDVMENGLGAFFDVVSGKWKALLLFHLDSGVKRPGELQRKIPDADRRVLDNQLTELLNHKMITKKTYDTKPPKVEYELTELGKTILPILCKMDEWGRGIVEPKSHNQIDKSSVDER